MKHLSIILRFLPFVACLATIVGAACSGAVGQDSPSAISRVEQMPNLPQPYVMRDWTQVTRDYLDLVFDFDQRGDHLPLVEWIGRRPHDGVDSRRTLAARRIPRQSTIWRPSSAGRSSDWTCEAFAAKTG